MRHLPLLCALALLTALPAPLRAQQKPAAHAEKLHYEVRFRSAHVARVDLHIGCPTSSYRSAALIASSRGLAQDLHDFHIRLDSFFDPLSLLPAQGRTHITEEGKTRRYISRFTGAPKISVSSTIFGAQRPEQSYTPPRRAHDLLSWLNHLRWQKSWAAGQTQSYHVWDGWKLVKLDASIRGKQTITTPHGSYETWAVDITRTRMRFDTSLSTFGASRTRDPLGTLWFTTGGDHILVGMDFASRLGMANIRLAAASRKPCKAAAP